VVVVLLVLFLLFNRSLRLHLCRLTGRCRGGRNRAFRGVELGRLLLLLLLLIDKRLKLAPRSALAR